MNYATSTAPVSKSRTLADRVRAIAGDLGCERVWTRAAGPHVLVGLDGEEAFARLTPLAIGAYGLSFRSSEAVGAAPAPGWDPVLLIDDLAGTVEHALVGEGAIAVDDREIGGARGFLGRFAGRSRAKR